MALRIVKSTAGAPSRDKSLLAANQAFAAGDLAGAVQHLTEAIAQGEDEAGLHLQLGVVLIQLERYDDALGSLRRALELQSEAVDAINAMGVVLFKLGHYSAAEAFFRRVIALAPQHPAAKNSLVEAMHRVRDADTATPADVTELINLLRPRDVS